MKGNICKNECNNEALADRAVCSQCRQTAIKARRGMCATPQCTNARTQRREHCQVCRPSLPKTQYTVEPSKRGRPRKYHKDAPRESRSSAHLAEPIRQGEVLVAGLRHHIGKFDRVYMLVNGQWIRSMKNKGDIVRALEKAETQRGLR